MPPRINSMTGTQTKRVNDAVLELSVHWLKLQDARTGRIRTRGAMADFARDCYIGRTRVAFTVREGEVCFGWLTWRLDPLFEPLAPPETELRVLRRP
jgi:hypothetical protein